jgi:hypothetical protein
MFVVVSAERCETRNPSSSNAGLRPLSPNAAVEAVSTYATDRATAPLAQNSPGRAPTTTLTPAAANGPRSDFTRGDGNLSFGLARMRMRLSLLTRKNRIAVAVGCLLEQIDDGELASVPLRRFVFLCTEPLFEIPTCARIKGLTSDRQNETSAMTDRVDRIGATDKVFWVSIATFATAIIVLYGLGCFVLLDTSGQTAMTQIVEAVIESGSTRSDVAPQTGDSVSSGAGTQPPDVIEARALLPPVAQSPPPVDTRPEGPESKANFEPPPKYEASDTILTPTDSSTEGPLADEITLEPTKPEQFGREPSIPVEQARVDPDASLTTMPAASTIDEGAFRAFQIFRSQNGSYIDARSVTVEAGSLPSAVAAPPRVIPLARDPVELKTLALGNGDAARNSASRLTRHRSASQPMPLPVGRYRHSSRHRVKRHPPRS